MHLNYKLLLFLFLITHFCQAQRLAVRSPDIWRSTQGTIEEAQFTIKPSGIYMEVGMYLTFSAREAKYITYENETINFENPLYDLESLLQFYLPSGAMVTDSWLWINEDIIQADIEERWKATQTYQEIVGYRLDPSLLTKEWTWYEYDKAQYTLRVYPLQGDSTRRVKITYLTPGIWNQGKVSVNLPIDILRASRIPVENISIQCFLNNQFSSPKILQLPNRNFSYANHATLGQYSQILLSNEDMENNIDVSFNVPMEQGVFLSNYEDGERDFYQLAILPQEILSDGAATTKKVAFLVDYDSSTTTISKETLLETLKVQLKANLNTGDLFNLFFVTQNGVKRINSSWINANDQIIETLFILIEESYTLLETSQLPQLLKAGIDYIQDNSNDGTLFLLSCAEQFHEQGIANEFITNLSASLPNTSLPIIIADYQNKNHSYDYYYYYYDDEMHLKERRYYGNEYFYLQLNEQFFGSTHVLREQGSLINLLNRSLQASNPVQAVNEINISRSEGNCFSHYILPRSSFSNNNNPYLQIGKCVGNYPFTIEVVGIVNNQLINKTIILDEPMINKGDENHATTWVGNYIESLENRRYYEYTQRLIEEIIDWSIEYRVLSLFTAFLALEPELGGYICEECVDETIPDHTVYDLSQDIRNDSENEVELPNITFGQTRGEAWNPPLGDSIITNTNNFNKTIFNRITAGPNPFRQGINIEVELKQTLSTGEIAFTIFDLNGKSVKTLSPQQLSGVSKFQAYWDGSDNQNHRLPEGMYILSIQTPNGLGSYKLILME